ncbi:MAG: hypothetical protein ACK40M_01330 [Flavobacteriales bacterium]
MRRLTFSFFILLTGLNGIAQKRFVAGFAYHAGSGTVNNYSYYRDYQDTPTGPVVTFDSLSPGKHGAHSMGLTVESFGKKWLVDFDLNYPRKRTTSIGSSRSSYIFNFGMARGGWIKEKLGLFFGASYTFYGSSIEPANPADTAVPTYNSTGTFKINLLPRHALGLDANVVWNFNDNMAWRSNVSYVITDHPATEQRASYEAKASGWKMEHGFYLTSGDVGLYVKYTFMQRKFSIEESGNVFNNGNYSSMVLPIIPEGTKHTMGYFSFGLMIPLSASSTSTRVTVVK